jgi:hypothetical protein
MKIDDEIEFGRLVDQGIAGPLVPHIQRWLHH